MISLLTLSQNIFLQGIQLLLSFDWYRFRRSGLGRAGVQLSGGAEEERKKEGKKFKENLIWLHSRDQSLVSCFLRSFISSSRLQLCFCCPAGAAWSSQWSTSLAGTLATRATPLLDFKIFSIITRANLCQLVQLGDISPFMSVFHVFSPKLPSLWIFITVRRCLIAAALATLINTTADR